MEYLIQLTNQEQYPHHGDLFPTITHAKLASVKWEVPFEHDDKPGQMEVWFSKGFIAGGHFHKALGYMGQDIIIPNEQLELVRAYNTEGGPVNEDITKILSQMAIDVGVIEGTLVGI